MMKRRLVWASAFALALAAFGVGCVDGVTPNCADASACAPTEGALPDGQADTSPRDAAPETGKPIPTPDGG